MVKILIADDHDIVRAGLRAVLEGRPGWTIVGEAADGRSAVQLAIDTKPDVIILDYSMPLMDGGEATRRVRAKLPATEVLIFTAHDSEALLREILRAGAKGYVLKSDAQRFLTMAVEALAAHRPFFTDRTSESLVNAYLNDRGDEALSILSSREMQVVRLVAEGHTNRGISEILGISVKTVEWHRASAMRKLNLSTTAALIHYAFRNKLVEP
jgi:DNA-binding NarL/FixJ family response regulator